MNDETTPPRIPFGLWFKISCLWLSEAWLFWLAIGIPTASFVALFSLGFPEQAIRICGLFHQILGILCVAVGVYKTRKLFGRQNLWSNIVAWIMRHPRTRVRYVDLGGLSSCGESSGSVRGQVVAHARDDSVEERLRALERNVTLLREDCEYEYSKLRCDIANVTEQVGSERRERQAEDNVLTVKLEESFVGGLNISAMGAMWLMIGAVLSSIAPELEIILKY